MADTIKLFVNGVEVEVPAGKNLVDAVAAGGVDLVLLDVGLPDASGLDVLARLRATAADADAVLQLTGIYHNLLRRWAVT